MVVEAVRNFTPPVAPVVRLVIEDRQTEVLIAVFGTPSTKLQEVDKDSY